jgi:phosphoribosylanthranilate isomerase
MQLKFCGLRRREEFELCAEEGVDYCGINLVPGSARFLPLDQALKQIENIRFNAVLIFRDAPAADVIDAALRVPQISAVQLHGEESLSEVRLLKERLDGVQVWKAVGVGSAEDLTFAENFASIADLVLLDAKHQGGRQTFGGEGKTFDWSWLKGWQSRSGRWGLSGGVRLENLDRAIELNPDLIDLASGIEEQRGVKSLELMRKVFRRFKVLHPQFGRA